MSLVEGDNFTRRLRRSVRLMPFGSEPSGNGNGGNGDGDVIVLGRLRHESARITYTKGRSNVVVEVYSLDTGQGCLLINEIGGHSGIRPLDAPRARADRRRRLLVHHRGLNRNPMNNDLASSTT